MNKKPITHKICCCCTDSKSIKDFYLASDDILNSDGKLNACKKCTADICDFDDVNSVIDLMRRNDKPFIKKEYDSVIEDGKGFGEYMRRMGMHQYRNLNYNDSKFEDHLKSPDLDSFEYEDDDEILSYWGRGYEDSEYHFLENEKHKLMTSFECPDYGMEMIMKDICFLNLDIEKTRQTKKDNTQKTITNLIETRSKLMNDANMKPIQSTGVEANDQVTLGTLIKKWESERPVPKPISDEMKEYMDTYVVGHLAKMEGLSNDATKKYDIALSKYTIDFNDIKRNAEEDDE